FAGRVRLPAASPCSHRLDSPRSRIHPTHTPMHALRAHERGGAEGLRYEPAADPIPGIGDAVVKVHAAGFTPTEMGWPSTWVDRAGKDRRPVVPAHEVSGVVTALG